MAEIISNLIKAKPISEEDRIQQGDYVFCKGTSGTSSFWGIYTGECIVALDGGGNYLRGERLYLHLQYSYWTISYRIKCKDAVIEVNERDA